jgi:CheY-like chemotaxis protein
MKNRVNHRVLVVDDDFDERTLSERALKKVLPPGSTVHLAGGGHHAIAYMIGERQFSDREAFPFPTLIITDLNMPDGDGFDVLEFLQGNPEWGVVPRIMFSSSENDDDVRTAFLLGVSAYHVKPTGSSAMIECMQSILDYWSSSKIPPVDENGKLLITSSAGRRGARYPQLRRGGPMRRPVPTHKFASTTKAAAMVTRLL